MIRSVTGGGALHTTLLGAIRRQPLQPFRGPHALSKNLAIFQFYSSMESPTRFGIIGSNHIVCSALPDIKLPTDDVYTLITKNFSRYGSKIGMIDGISGRRYSYDEIHEAICKFSSGLQRLGLVKGDVLAIVSPNSTDFPVVFLGTLAAGPGVWSPHVTLHFLPISWHTS